MVVWGGMTEVGLRVSHACGNPRILFDVVDTFCFICSYLLFGCLRGCACVMRFYTCFRFRLFCLCGVGVLTWPPFLVRACELKSERKREHERTGGSSPLSLSLSLSLIVSLRMSLTVSLSIRVSLSLLS